MSTAEHQATSRHREVEHAKWRVSAVEFILQTHRKRQSRGAEWQREDDAMVLRLQLARAELARMSRIARGIRFQYDARLDLAA
jgi:hypothetical protein